MIIPLNLSSSTALIGDYNSINLSHMLGNPRDDLSYDSMVEQKKRVGGGGQCYVPGCVNTRRHNPGLKWYRIPKVC